MSVPPPSGISAGALEVAYISTYNASGMATPSGWRLLDTVVVDGQYGPNYLYVLDRFYQSSDTSYTFGSNNLNYPEVVIRAFSGVNQSTPVRAYNDNNSAGTASVTAPALSASTVANEMQVAFFADDNAPSVTSTNPSLNDFAAGSAQYGTLEGDLQIPAVGTIPQAITGNASAGGNWMASVIELEPASGNSTPTPTPDPTSTVAPTATPTPQSTYTPAPAATATSTPAPTASATPTPDPSATATPGGFQPVQGYTNTEVAQGTDPTLATDWATDGGRWMQNQILDMAVSPAGEIYLANYWSEGLMVNGMYHFSGGKGVSDGPLPCNGANWGGGYGAASNSRYLWISDRATGGNGNSIWKYNVNGTANSCSSVSTGIDGSTGSAGEFADIMGLAASDTGGNGGQGELFVADAAGDKVLVYDAASMAEERQFSFAPGGTAMQPRRIAYDPGSGTLWISSGLDRYDFHGEVYHYSTAGAQLSGTISDVSIPTALAVDQGNLWIGDSGPDMQLKVYNAASGARLTGSCSWGPCGSFGVQGGYLAGPTPGLAGPNRLEFPISVRFDSSHDLYVAQSMPPAGTWAWGCWICDGSNVEQFNVGPNNVAYDAAVREYSPSGGLIAEMRANTEIEDVGALDAGTDGADMFNAWNHFKMDWTQAPTGEWSYAGTTIDPIHYPSDIRIAMLDSNNVPFAHRVITINGVRYLFVTGQDGGHQGIFHQPAGSDIFVPDAAFNNRSLDGWVMTSDNTSLQPCYRDGCGYIWSDTNGDGAPQASEFQQLPNSEVGNVTNFDDDGNAWTAGSDGILRRFRVSGFGATGGLQYSASAIDNFGQPAPFNDVTAAWYDVASDTVFVSGFTASAPNNGESVDGKWVAGSTVAAYPNWSQGNRTAKWVSALPYNSNSLTGTARAWQEAGGKLFFLQASGKTVFVYDANSGQHLFDIVGHMPGTPDPGAVNWNAGWDDSLQTLTAFQRSDGEYIVTLETLMADRISVMRGLLNNNVSQ